MTMKSTRRVLGPSLLCSLARSHRSLIRLLRTARFARALHCALSFARSLTHSLTPELMGKWFMSTKSVRRFHTISTHCAVLPSIPTPGCSRKIRSRRERIRAVVSRISFSLSPACHPLHCPKSWRSRPATPSLPANRFPPSVKATSLLTGKDALLLGVRG